MSDDSRASTGRSTLRTNRHKSYFLSTKSSTRQMERMRARMMGPMTHTMPASSVLPMIDTSVFSDGTLGLGRLGGAPGGTCRMSRERNSENGLDVYKCCEVRERERTITLGHLIQISQLSPTNQVHLGLIFQYPVEESVSFNSVSNKRTKKRPNSLFGVAYRNCL